MTAVRATRPQSQLISLSPSLCLSLFLTLSAGGAALQAVLCMLSCVCCPGFRQHVLLSLLSPSPPEEAFTHTYSHTKTHTHTHYQSTCV